MKVFILISVFVCFIPMLSMAQVANQAIQSGNELYRAQKYTEAETEYNKAIQKDPSNFTALFNLANAIYREGKQDDAARAFLGISERMKEPDHQSKAFYNQGVVFSQEKKLEESIEAYKNALRKNPDDKEARENLQKALTELKKKNPPKKEDDKKKKKDQQQQPQKQPKMSPREAEQRLKLLEQKEKEVEQRMQDEKGKSTTNQAKDW